MTGRWRNGPVRREQRWSCSRGPGRFWLLVGGRRRGIVGLARGIGVSVRLGGLDRGIGFALLVGINYIECVLRQVARDVLDGLLSLLDLLCPTQDLVRRLERGLRPETDGLSVAWQCEQQRAGQQWCSEGELEECFHSFALAFCFGFRRLPPKSAFACSFFPKETAGHGCKIFCRKKARVSGP
jgi:hypothetical protein